MITLEEVRATALELALEMPGRKNQVCEYQHTVTYERPTEYGRTIIRPRPIGPGCLVGSILWHLAPEELPFYTDNPQVGDYLEQHPHMFTEEAERWLYEAQGIADSTGPGDESGVSNRPYWLTAILQADIRCGIEFGRYDRA